jgi:hypothetical protein
MVKPTGINKGGEQWDYIDIAVSETKTPKQDSNQIG